MGPRWWTSWLPLDLEPQYMLIITHQQAKWHTHRCHDSSKTNHKDQKLGRGVSLVAQWLGVRLPMQGTQVRALVWKAPTCCGAAGSAYPNYWGPRAWSPRSAAREATAMRGTRTARKSSPRSPQLGKAHVQQCSNEDPTQPEINK